MSAGEISPRDDILSVLRYPEVCATRVWCARGWKTTDSFEVVSRRSPRCRRRGFELNRGSDESWIDDCAVGTAGKGRHREAASYPNAGTQVEAGRLSRYGGIS